MTKLQEQISSKQALKNKNFIKQSNKDKQKAKTKRLKSLGKDVSLLFLPIISEMILQHISDIGNIFSNIEDEIEQLIRERVSARAEKRYSDADNVRKRLLDKGIVLEDSAQGTTWRRI